MFHNSHIIVHYWWLMLLPFAIAVIKSPWFKGVWGEFMVNMAARLYLDKDKYHLIKNVTIPTEDGTTQIDHIIVSRFGVFVVETKNMRGWIFGAKRWDFWTQQIFKAKYQFQNPLRQNYKHTQTLQKLLNIDPDQLISVIVFVGGSTFKTEMPENVTYGGDYIRFIKSYTRTILSGPERREIIRKIESGRLTPSIQTSRKHAQHVKQIVAEKQKTPSASAEAVTAIKEVKTCPKCGNNMVLRIAQKGPNAGNEFWGCSSFPKCRAIAELG